MAEIALPEPQEIFRKRVGLFAGVFDPIHEGHLEVARTAVDFLSLNKLYLMVEERAWGNKNPVDVVQRQKMVDLSISSYPKIEQLKIGDKQFDIAHTLASLEAKFSNTEMYFIFGADVFLAMNPKQWLGLERLYKHYIVVFERNDITEQGIAKHAKSLGIAVAILPSANPKHSSTDVRLNPHKKAVWVTQKVAKYIDKNRLY